MSFHSYHPSVASNQGKVACERVIRRKCLGSGDPPGLQNRRSSLTGDGVFDSHALPPAYVRNVRSKQRKAIEVAFPDINHGTKLKDNTPRDALRAHIYSATEQR